MYSYHQKTEKQTNAEIVTTHVSIFSGMTIYIYI